MFWDAGIGIGEWLVLFLVQVLLIFEIDLFLYFLFSLYF